MGIDSEQDYHWSSSLSPPILVQCPFSPFSCDSLVTMMRSVQLLISCSLFVATNFTLFCLCCSYKVFELLVFCPFKIGQVVISWLASPVQKILSLAFSLFPTLRFILVCNIHLTASFVLASLFVTKYVFVLVFGFDFRKRGYTTNRKLS